MRNFIAILCLMLPLSVLAQERYSVYSCNNDAYIYNYETNKWESASKGTRLTLETIVNIGDSEGFQVLDSQTHRIYSCVKSGRQTIKSLISKATKKSNSTLGNFNKQVVSNISTSRSFNKIYSTYGVTTRGDGELTFADTLYYSIYQGISSADISDALCLQEHRNTDSTVTFAIVNNTGEQYFVNLVYGNNSQLRSCFEDNAGDNCAFIVSPNSSLNLAGFSFMPSDEGNKYYLIASQRKFSLASIKNSLQYMVPPDFSAASDLVYVIPSK